MTDDLPALIRAQMEDDEHSSTAALVHVLESTAEQMDTDISEFEASFVPAVAKIPGLLGHRDLRQIYEYHWQAARLSGRQGWAAPISGLNSFFALHSPIIAPGDFNGLSARELRAIVPQEVPDAAKAIRGVRRALESAGLDPELVFRFPAADAQSDADVNDPEPVSIEGETLGSWVRRQELAEIAHMERRLSDLADEAGRGSGSKASTACRELFKASGLSLDALRDKRFFPTPWVSLHRILLLFGEDFDMEHGNVQVTIERFAKRWR